MGSTQSVPSKYTELSEKSLIGNEAQTAATQSNVSSPTTISGLDVNKTNQRIFSELQAMVSDKSAAEAADRETDSNDTAVTDTEVALDCNANVTQKVIGHQKEEENLESDRQLVSPTERNLVNALNHHQTDAASIQQNIVQGRYEIARIKMQQMCEKTIIDQKRAYILDKGDPNSLPMAIVHKQSAFPFLVGGVKKSKDSLKLPNQDITASESDSLLASR